MPCGLLAFVSADSSGCWSYQECMSTLLSSAAEVEASIASALPPEVVHAAFVNALLSPAVLACARQQFVANVASAAAAVTADTGDEFGNDDDDDEDADV